MKHLLQFLISEIIMFKEHYLYFLRNQRSKRVEQRNHFMIYFIDETHGEQRVIWY